MLGCPTVSMTRKPEESHFEAKLSVLDCLQVLGLDCHCLDWRYGNWLIKVSIALALSVISVTDATNGVGQLLTRLYREAMDFLDLL